jgi:hypothetical protein
MRLHRKLMLNLDMKKLCALVLYSLKKNMIHVQDPLILWMILIMQTMTVATYMDKEF